MTRLTPPPYRTRRLWLPLAVVSALLVLVLALLFRKTDTEPATDHRPATTSQFDREPPWRYGDRQARFTLVLYADLECPYCQSYSPVLINWVDSNPDVNLEWRHLPLAIHEPAASEEARWLECVGRRFGSERFWEAASWMYQNTRGNGEGLPPGVVHPDVDDDVVSTCLESESTRQIVRSQAEEAQREGIHATPSLRLIDNPSGHTLTLSGPVPEDTLLSALDLLSAPEADTSLELSADIVSDTR